MIEAIKYIHRYVIVQINLKQFIFLGSYTVWAGLRHLRRSRCSERETVSRRTSFGLTSLMYSIRANYWRLIIYSSFKSFHVFWERGIYSSSSRFQRPMVWAFRISNAECNFSYTSLSLPIWSCIFIFENWYLWHLPYFTFGLVWYCVPEIYPWKQIKYSHLPQLIDLQNDFGVPHNA